jgi:membrane-associated protease RseP (regulator of RpoE activity)
MTPHPGEVILRDVVARLEPVFTVERYYGRPPGVILVGRFSLGGDAGAAERLLAPYGYYLRAGRMASGQWMVEVSPRPLARPRKRVWVNVLLFVATVGTTLAVGAMQRGGDITRPADWLLGVPFSASLMGILLCHEMAHFTASRRHHVAATLPYFLPVPHPLLGTFGAFIKMESPIPDRRALLDIGAAGPLAGFAVALPLTIIGLHLSAVVPHADIVKGSLALGDSLLFRALTHLVKGPLPGREVMLHPLALAGWIGMWVTAMNLLPMGQLDGGHVSYALFGPRSVWVARVALAALVGLGFMWNGWWVWAVFVLLLVRLKHPAPLDEAVALGPARRFVGWLVFFIGALTFIPTPVTPWS